MSCIRNEKIRISDARKRGIFWWMSLEMRKSELPMRETVEIAGGCHREWENQSLRCVKQWNFLVDIIENEKIRVSDAWKQGNCWWMSSRMGKLEFPMCGTGKLLVDDIENEKIKVSDA